MRTRISTRELLVVFLFWTTLATLSAVNQLLEPRGFGLRFVSPAGPIALGYAEAWMWALLTPVIFGLTERIAGERAQWAKAVPVLIAAGIVISIALSLALAFVRVEVFDLPGRTPPSFRPFRELGRFRFLNQLLVYFGVVAVGYARALFFREQTQREETVELEKRTARLSAQLAEARLEALKGQINPHFLFNTLNAISALVERDPAGVRRMIARLGELLRRTIDASGSDRVTLREELELLGRYIEIMEVRFQGRIRVERAIDPAVEAIRVPMLLLQPIVENALEHGATRAGQEGWVEIAASARDDAVVITVSDNGPGPGSDAGTGVGLANTRARLRELYGDRASLQLAARPEGGAVTTIVVPFEEAPRG